MTGSPIAVQIIRILYDFRSRILRCRSVRRAVEFIKAIATHRLALLFPLHRFPFSSQIERDFPLSPPPCQGNARNAAHVRLVGTTDRPFIFHAHNYRRPSMPNITDRSADRMAMRRKQRFAAVSAGNRRKSPTKNSTRRPLYHTSRNLDVIYFSLSLSLAKNIGTLSLVESRSRNFNKIGRRPTKNSSRRRLFEIIYLFSLSLS